jgi:tetratricopeptide (TPR) repeat protein
MALCAPVARGAASDSGEARGYFDKATASFALGHYAVAAENYEKAFELKPDPALLYNAAQAHRLAGNKERAVTLYQNYLRLYAKAVRRTEVEARIEELKKAIKRDHELATSPPTTTLPSSMPPASPSTAAAEPAAPTPTPASPPPPRVASTSPGAPAASSAPPAIDLKPSPAAPVLVAQPESGATDKRSLTRKPLFWTAVGGGVAAVVVVVLIVALGGAKDPSPSLGVVR